MDLRAATSDWHLLHGGRTEPANRELILEFVKRVIEAKVKEVLLLGDIFDRTRGADEDALVKWFVENVVKPLQAAGIFITYVWGNHEGDYSAAKILVEKIRLAGANPLLFNFSTGPEFRGIFTLEHGQVFDPWCNQHGSFRTTVGEVFTRVDHWGDHVGVDIEKLNPLDIGEKAESVEFDHPIHMRANRRTALSKTNLIFGHTHNMYCLNGDGWSVYNTGSLTKGHRVEYILFNDFSAKKVSL